MANQTFHPALKQFIQELDAAGIKWRTSNVQSDDKPYYEITIEDSIDQNGTINIGAIFIEGQNDGFLLCKINYIFGETFLVTAYKMVNKLNQIRGHVKFCLDDFNRLTAFNSIFVANQEAGKCCMAEYRHFMETLKVALPEALELARAIETSANGTVQGTPSSKSVKHLS